MSSAPINSDETYRGRFAPSPTGPLHFGSLIAATASYLQARHQQGQWYLRIEDIDPPREIPGATEKIISTLQAYGFEWDANIIYQSQRLEIYQHYLQQLIQNQHTFACTCSRKEINQHLTKSSSTVYPGTCRNKTHIINSEQYAYRVIAQNGNIDFYDQLQGQQRYHLHTDIGDFVVQRADGLFSYQLAVAIDDGSMGITEVVRGCDLLNSTPRQIYLQQLLKLNTPNYIHLPVAIDAQGQKLSKQTHARALDTRHPVNTLWQVLISLLGQSPPDKLGKASLSELWQWAIANWNIQMIPQTAAFIFRENK